MHKKISVFLAIAILSLPSAGAFAQESTITTAQQMKTELKGQKEQNKTEKTEIKQTQAKKVELAEKRLEFQDKKEKMTEERCKNLEKKIANRVNRYENNGKMQQKVYGNMQTRLERLIAKLKTSGANTEQLEKDYAILKTKIQKLYADQAAFMLTLKDSQSFACGKSEGEFGKKLTESRKVPELIKQDREDIKKFFQTTIKADLQAIRATLTDEKEETETEMPKAPKTEAAKKQPAAVSTTPTTSTIPQ